MAQVTLHTRGVEKRALCLWNVQRRFVWCPTRVLLLMEPFSGIWIRSFCSAGAGATATIAVDMMTSFLKLSVERPSNCGAHMKICVIVHRAQADFRTCRSSMALGLTWNTSSVVAVHRCCNHMRTGSLTPLPP